MPDGRFHTYICGGSNKKQIFNVERSQGEVEICAEKPIVSLFLDRNVSGLGFELVYNFSAPRAVDIDLVFGFGMLVYEMQNP